MPLISRWGLMHCIKKENISEHSHQVGSIALMLGVIGNVYFKKRWNVDRLASLGLFHEMSESKLNDLSSPVKYSNENFTREYKRLERMAEEECLQTLPAEMQDAMRDYIIQDYVDTEYKALVKAADIIAAYIKSLDELSFQNKEFVDVKASLERQLREINLPEVDLFLSTFVQKCTATVDDLCGEVA